MGLDGFYLSAGNDGWFFASGAESSKSRVTQGREAGVRREAGLGGSSAGGEHGGGAAGRCDGSGSSPVVPCRPRHLRRLRDRVRGMEIFSLGTSGRG